MRFTAPADTSDVTIAAGTFPVVDGVVETPDDLDATQVDALRRAGFIPAPPAAKAKPSKDA